MTNPEEQEQAVFDQLWQRETIEIYEAVRAAHMDDLGGHNRFIAAIADEIVERRGLNARPEVNQYRNAVTQTMAVGMRAGIMNSLLAVDRLSGPSGQGD